MHEDDILNLEENFAFMQQLTIVNVHPFLTVYLLNPWYHGFTVVTELRLRLQNITLLITSQS